MKKTGILLLLFLLLFTQTAWAAVEMPELEHFEIMEIKENIPVDLEKGDFSKLTAYLEKNVKGFSKENCFISRAGYNSDDGKGNIGFGVYYTYYYRGVSTRGSLSVSGENGIAISYINTLDRFQKPKTEPFGLQYVHSSGFQDVVVKEARELAYKETWDYKKDPGTATVIKEDVDIWIDKENRVCISVVLVYDYLHTNFVGNDPVHIMKIYDYYLDEHKETVLKSGLQ